MQASLSKKLPNLDGLVVARSDDDIMLPRWGVHQPGMPFCPLVQWRISSGAQAILLRRCQLRSIRQKLDERCAFKEGTWLDATCS